MERHTSFADAVKSGLPTIIKDSETEYRCYSYAERPPPPTLPIGPPPVSAWKIRKALNATGLRAQVEAAVAVADQDVQDGWDTARDFERDHPLILSMVAQMGLPDEQVDQLFALAATL